MLYNIVMFLNWFLVCFLILVGLGYIVLLFASLRDVFLRFQEVKLGEISTTVKSQAMPPVTVLIPAYNEENDILDSVQSVLNSDYPNFQVLVINDGSTDATLEKLIDKYNLYKTTPFTPTVIPTKSKIKGYYLSNSFKNIIVIDKDHVDKSDSLNTGLNACRTPLLLTIDADTLIEPDAISEAVFYMMVRPHAVAVGGSLYILNNCTVEDGKITRARMPYSLVPSWQTCEYLRSFVINRAGWNLFGGSLVFAGAFTLLEHKAVVDIGGFDEGNPSMDFEVITHLHADKLKSDTPYQIGTTPAATAWTRVPETLGEYWKQRSTWQWGTIRSLMRHKNMFFNPRYKGVGLFAYPFFLIVETLGSIVELLAYINIALSVYLGILDIYIAVLFFIICWLFVTLMTMSTVLISFNTYNKYQRLIDLPWMLLISALEGLGFRQYYVVCRVWATLKYLFTWGKRKDNRDNDSNQRNPGSD